MVVLGLLALATCLQTANADGCRRVVTHQQVIHHAPVQTVVVADHHNAFHQGFHETVIVPKAFRVVVSQDAYSTVADEYRQAIFARLVAEEYAKILSARQPGSPAPGPAATPTPTTPIPKADPIPDLTPAIEKMMRQKELELQGFKKLDADELLPTLDTPVNPKLVQVIAGKCSACHLNGANKINLSENALAKLPEGKRWKSFGLVNSGRMPLKKPQLPDDEVQLFYDWAEEAAKVASQKAK